MMPVTACDAEQSQARHLNCSSCELKVNKNGMQNCCKSTSSLGVRRVSITSGTANKTAYDLCLPLDLCALTQKRSHGLRRHLCLRTLPYCSLGRYHSERSHDHSWPLCQQTFSQQIHIQFSVIWGTYVAILQKNLPWSRNDRSVF